MLLCYIYNEFILKLFLEHSGCKCQENFPRHAEEPNM